MRTENVKESQERYRVKNIEKVRVIVAKAVKKHYSFHKDEILVKKKEYYQQKKDEINEKIQWKNFINNQSIRLEKKLFLNILLDE